MGLSDKKTELDDIFSTDKMDTAIELKLSSAETMDMLGVLNFTYDTLLYLIKEEVKDGRSTASAQSTQLHKYFTAAEQLLVKVHAAIDTLGVPPMSERH